MNLFAWIASCGHVCVGVDMLYVWDNSINVGRARPGPGPHTPPQTPPAKGLEPFLYQLQKMDPVRFAPGCGWVAWRTPRPPPKKRDDNLFGGLRCGTTRGATPRGWVPPFGVVEETPGEERERE